MRKKKNTNENNSLLSDLCACEVRKFCFIFFTQIKTHYILVNKNYTSCITPSVLHL